MKEEKPKTLYFTPEPVKLEIKHMEIKVDPIDAMFKAPKVNITVTKPEKKAE